MASVGFAAEEEDAAFGGIDHDDRGEVLVAEADAISGVLGGVDFSGGEGEEDFAFVVADLGFSGAADRQGRGFGGDGDFHFDLSVGQGGGSEQGGFCLGVHGLLLGGEFAQVYGDGGAAGGFLVGGGSGGDRRKAVGLLGREGEGQSVGEGDCLAIRAEGGENFDRGLLGFGGALAIESAGEGREEAEQGEG